MRENDPSRKIKKSEEQPDVIENSDNLSPQL
jgi:hypothetical protein